MTWDLTPYSYVDVRHSGENKSIGIKEVHINKKIGGKTLENQSKSNGMEKKEGTKKGQYHMGQIMS
jgi:hypothetical protein